MKVREIKKIVVKFLLDEKNGQVVMGHNLQTAGLSAERKREAALGAGGVSGVGVGVRSWAGLRLAGLQYRANVKDTCLQLNAWA